MMFEMVKYAFQHYNTMTVRLLIPQWVECMIDVQQEGQDRAGWWMKGIFTDYFYRNSLIRGVA